MPTNPKAQIRVRSSAAPGWDDSADHADHKNNKCAWCFHCWEADGRKLYDKNKEESNYWGDPDTVKSAKPPISILGTDWKFPENRSELDTRDYDAECGIFKDGDHLKSQRKLHHYRSKNTPDKSRPVTRFIWCGGKSGTRRVVKKLAKNPNTKTTKEKESTMAAPTLRSKLFTNAKSVATNAKQGSIAAAQLTGAKAAMTIAHRAVLEGVRESNLPMGWKMGALVVIDNDYGKAGTGLVVGAVLPFVTPWLPPAVREAADTASVALFTRAQQLIFENWGDKLVGKVTETLVKMAPVLGVEIDPKLLGAPSTEGFTAPAERTKAPASTKRSSG